MICRDAQGKKINIFDSEIAKDELSDILKRALEHPENRQHYGALRLRRETKDDTSTLFIENEIFFNQKGR
ncbi:MAG: hypothetical protein GXP45_02980 [bacterium]|nr:hypothetical protein [bacterium]